MMTDKDVIIREAKKYFKDNSILDLTGYIQENCPDTHRHSAFVRDIAYKMQRSGIFKMQEIKDRYYVTPLSRDEQIYNSTRWFLPFISFLLSVGAYVLSLIAINK